MTTNPYRSPTTAPADIYTAPPVVDHPYSPRIWSTEGRIGRLRYLAYSFVTQIVLAFLAGLLAAVLIPTLGGDSNATPVVFGLVALIYVPILVSVFVMAKRRLNDMNQTGWFSLFMIVPFANLILGLLLLFWPGTKGSNNYGPAPEKNSLAVILFGLVIPIALIGILAAVAIPAYQQYVAKAQQQATQSQATP